MNELLSGAVPLFGGEIIEHLCPRFQCVYVFLFSLRPLWYDSKMLFG